MTGHRLRIDSIRVSSKMSREKLNKLIFQILRVLGKALKDRITPKWSLVAPAASKLILGGARFLPPKNESHRNPEKWKMETWTSQNDEKTRTHKSLILFSFMSVFILAQTITTAQPMKPFESLWTDIGYMRSDVCCRQTRHPKLAWYSSRISLNYTSGSLRAQCPLSHL